MWMKAGNVCIGVSITELTVSLTDRWQAVQCVCVWREQEREL